MASISIRNSIWRPPDGDGLPLEITPGAALLFPLLYFFDSGGWFAALLPSVALHELGHWAAVRICRGTVRSLTLDVTGLYMDISPLSSKSEEVFCAMAGPAAGLSWLLFGGLIGGEYGERSALAAEWINLFNLLPALPLDGGRAVYALTSQRLAEMLSAVTALCLAAAGILCAVPGLLLPAGLIVITVLKA